MENTDSIAYSVPPEYGLKIKLDHVYPEKNIPHSKPKLSQVLPLIPLGARYLGYFWKCKIRGIKPVMDFINLENAKHIYGCPIGGIGSGTIGRGYKGEFCRYQLRPGVCDYAIYPENQFIVNIRDQKNETIFQSVLSTYVKPKNAPASWEWNLKGSDCEYTGLYPRAWTTYNLSQYGVKLICRQISPVIPHNYKDSSLPCAVFVWDVINVCGERRSVSISFTFRDACFSNKKNSPKGNLIFERYSDNQTCGVSLETSISDMMCTFTIAKRKQPHDSTTDGFCKFDTKKTTAQVWNCLKSEGRLIPSEISSDNNTPANAIGLSNHATLEAGGVTSFEFCLVWDMPIVHFGQKKQKHSRYYTRFFGNEGIAGPSIASYALVTYKKWEEDIDDWQNPILEDELLPSWYKGAIMNELYYIADGGTVWFDVSDTCPREDPRWNYGVFGYLEGHEYRMYNTYDVHFYASFALAQLWPRLQISLQYQFKEAVPTELGNRINLFDGKKSKRKAVNTIPHDLGDPAENPFTAINAYNIHDVSEWRDLNLKFILQVFRDVSFMRKEKMEQDILEKYKSLEYIDDISEASDDLYIRSTNQTSHTDLPSETLLTHSHFLNHKSKTKPINGFCKHAEEFKMNNFKPREKHVSISSIDYTEDDFHKHPNVMRQNSSGRPFLFHTQLSHGGEAMTEAALIDDVVDVERYMSDMYPTCRALVDRMLTWDADGDGLIENTGSPDQTFDAWVMTGPSAYCGGLWLAALHCMYTMACFQDIQEDIIFFSKLLEKGKASYESTLWNGNYYDFDKQSNAIMADQLCGHWYLRACGYQYPVFPKENVLSALNKIYENNVLKFGDGKLGAVNGYVPGNIDKSGHIDFTSIQSEECWTGVTYGLSALMLHEGLTEEAFKTAGGLYNSLCYRFGMSFETPEAVYESGNYRSVGYMRPLSIWAMQHALKTNSLKN